MARFARVLLFSALSIGTAGLVAAATGTVSNGPHQSALAAQAVTAELTDLYVDATHGMDTDLCGTGLELPCQTIRAALYMVPNMLVRDVTVHIAAGTYEGGILISGRSSIDGSRLILTGEPGLTFIAGPAGRDTGISIVHSTDVVLQNLNVQGFPRAGVRVLLSSGIHLRSMTLSGNGDGLFAGESESWLSSSVVQNNHGNGVSCQGGWITLGSDDPSVTMFFAGNAGAGIMVTGCQASLEGPATILGNSDGLLAVHGGEINLNMRVDIGVYAAAGSNSLTADCHGMITGFANSCSGTCGCLEMNYGVCQSGQTPVPGGRTRTPPMDTLP